MPLGAAEVAALPLSRASYQKFLTYSKLKLLIELSELETQHLHET